MKLLTMSTNCMCVPNEKQVNSKLIRKVAKRTNLLNLKVKF